MDNQEAFDEAFNAIEVEFALDDVVEKLAAIGLRVEPWQRDVVRQWLDSESLDTPLSTRVGRLRRRLRLSS